MRIAVRTQLVVSLAVALSLGVTGALLLAMEARHLDDAIQREMTVLAEATRSTIENAIRDRQRDDVNELADVLRLAETPYAVWLVDHDGSVLQRLGSAEARFARDIDPAAEVAARSMLRSGEAAWLNTSDAERALHVLALPFAKELDEELGGMVLIRSSFDVEQDLTRTSGVLLVMSLCTIALVIALGVVLTRTFLAGRLRTFHAAMGDIATGRLDTRISMRVLDETEEMAREFNRMAQALQDAHRRVEEEAERRRRAEVMLLRSERLAIVGQLAAGLAHEIGTPMQLIAGRARSLERTSIEPDRVKRLAAQIGHQAERVTAIMQRLLNAARPTPIEWVMVDPSVVCGRVPELFESELKRRNCRVEVDCPGALRVRLPSGLLDQVLINLVANSIQAGARNIRLAVSRTTTPETDAHLAVEVSDDGGGIAPEHLDRIWEPFFSGDPAGMRTGLGLSIVRQAVTEVGGSIECSTLPSRGASFVVRFAMAMNGEAN